MEIQNFRFYLQDATNFFSILDYTFSEDIKPIGRSIFNWFYDPLKINGKWFHPTEDSFTIRCVVDKEDATKTLIEIFDSVVRYYNFQQFEDYIGPMTLWADKKREQLILYALLPKGDKFQLSKVNLIKTKTKAIIETLVFTSKTFDYLRPKVEHREEEKLDVLGGEVDSDTIDDYLEKRFCFEEFVGDNEPPRVVIKTGHEIIDEYWPFWQTQMVSNFGAEDKRINFKNCIDDYCVMNWAWEIDGNGNKI